MRILRENRLPFPENARREIEKAEVPALNGLWEKWGNEMVLFDGAMGTMLQQAGLPQGAMPESWNMECPDAIRSIHQAYLDAGCDVITANTFGANSQKCDATPYSAPELVERGVRLAVEAVAKSGRMAKVAVDIGPTGRLLEPLGDLPFETAYTLFAEMAKAGEAAGADLVLIETMNDPYELKAAVLAAKENTSLPVIATMIFDSRGRLLTGGDVMAAVALLEGLRVDALGVNCGMGPEQMKGLLEEMLACSSLPVVMNPNAGLPHCVDGCTVFDTDPETFAQTMEELARMGAWGIGGCCGTTPDHIAAVSRRCRGIRPRPLRPKDRTVVSSYGRAVTIDGPVLIGERINPTGKSKFKQALRDGNIEYLLREGIAQQEAGAHILDVNVGLPEIDETAWMTRAVKELQAILDLPLQIDTADVATMEAAMRIYNGKPLVNSVNGKKASMETVFPLVRKYGGVVVALTLDENGIPPTAEGRLAVARRIVDTAATYGIDKKDILVDVLTMAVSADPNAAKVTLDALRLVRESLGVHTVLGVSNVSFGLPQRENVNTAFYTLALHNGLDAAILNPCSAGMKRAYLAYQVLDGRDEQCAAYIAGCAETAAASSAPAAQQTLGLREAIVKGLKEQAFTEAGRLAEKRDPLAVVDGELVPALDEVGRGYEQGTLFLPQLLMSAEAAGAAFEALRARMEAAGQASEKKGRVLLATVKGDIHDIGKNIVRALLENYGYEVVDLGKDVDPALIVDTVREQRISLVGLSALMTTTVSSMAETIRMLRQAALPCKVVVGGAVLTQEYADQIGADCYSPDAMATVRYAEKIFGK